MIQKSRVSSAGALQGWYQYDLQVLINFRFYVLFNYIMLQKYVNVNEVAPTPDKKISTQ